MSFGFFDLIKIVGALGFFLYGMKVMSDSLQLVAGSAMRKVLATMTTNRVTGVLTGFLITAILQSSSATTVMTVSFVNAGLMSLVESAGVMMGANIGTTITAWIVSEIGLKVKITALALPILAFGFPLLFSSKEKNKQWAQVIIGFALLLMGLGELKDAVPNLKDNPEVLSFLSEFSNPNFLTRLMFVGVGTILTIVVQSSSAAMTLTIVLATQGLPFEIAASMVLGENIGTTITAQLAALMGNVHAKRAARIHFFFNFIGVCWMIILMPWFLDAMTWAMTMMFGDLDNARKLAGFHTSFNVVNVLLMIAFVPQIVKLALKTVKSKGDEDEEFRLEYIAKGVFAPSEMAIGEASKEMVKFAEVVKKMSTLLFTLSDEVKEKKINKLVQKISKLENLTDEMEVQIGDFMTKVSGNVLTSKSSIELRGILSIAGDLERIADIIYSMSRNIRRKYENKINFTEEQKIHLNEMSKLVGEAIDVMMANISTQDRGGLTIDEALKKEQEIDKFRKRLIKADLKDVENQTYDVKAGIVYRDLFN
ncbi:MAG: Na/Pi cotransporter family protein, partial [Bacteroidota bacterium]